MNLNLLTIACGGGALTVLAGLAGLLAPAPVRAGLNRFPRHAGAGRLLAGLALVWVAWIVLHAQLGRFAWLKPGVYVLAPVSFALMVLFMDELLAVRALGGVLLLLGDPILDAIRWHDSPWRLVVTTLTYIMVTAGMMLVLSPYYFRTWAGALAGSPARCRLTGAALCLLGVALIVLGLVAG